MTEKSRTKLADEGKRRADAMARILLCGRP